jgi:hypothetical protein
MISHYPEMEEREIRDFCVKLDDKFRNTDRDYMFPINKMASKPAIALPIEDKKSLMEIKYTLKDFNLENQTHQQLNLFYKIKEKIGDFFESQARPR